MGSDGEPSSRKVATNAGLGHGPGPSAFSISGYSNDSPNGERCTSVACALRGREVRDVAVATDPPAENGSPTTSRPADRVARHQFTRAYDNRANASYSRPTPPCGTAG